MQAALRQHGIAAAVVLDQFILIILGHAVHGFRIKLFAQQGFKPIQRLGVLR